MIWAALETDAVTNTEIKPSGLVPNHWVFGVCHVNMDPPGDPVLAVNPQSQYLIQGGLAQILSFPTTREKAEAAISCLLLDAFANPADRSVDPSVPAFAPPFI
jgi:hypothetical protein